MNVSAVELENKLRQLAVDPPPADKIKAVMDSWIDPKHPVSRFYRWLLIDRLRREAEDTPTGDRPPETVESLRAAWGFPSKNHLMSALFNAIERSKVEIEELSPELTSWAIIRGSYVLPRPKTILDRLDRHANRKEQIWQRVRRHVVLGYAWGADDDRFNRYFGEKQIPIEQLPDDLATYAVIGGAIGIISSVIQLCKQDPQTNHNKLIILAKESGMQGPVEHLETIITSITAQYPDPASIVEAAMFGVLMRGDNNFALVRTLVQIAKKCGTDVGESLRTGALAAQRRQGVIWDDDIFNHALKLTATD